MKKLSLLFIFILLLIVIALGLLFSRGKLLPSQKNPPTQKTQNIPPPGSCIVLPEKYCAYAELVTLNGKTLIGFKIPKDQIPEEGIPVYSPIDGIVDKTDYTNAKNPVIPGYDATTRTKTGDEGYNVSGNVDIGGNLDTANTGKGKVIVYIKDLGIQLPGGYLFFLYPTHVNVETNHIEFNPDAVAKMFPNLNK